MPTSRGGSFAVELPGTDTSNSGAATAAPVSVDFFTEYSITTEESFPFGLKVTV
jgi:hypothetical protein